MMIDNIYVVYENSGKYFPTYTSAYFNSKKPCCDKKIYYIFTPTERRCSTVSELENVCRNYFNHTFDCDYLDIVTNVRSKQLRLEVI